MCGIAGIFAMGGRRVPPALDLMSEVLTHRGPDDSGRFEANKVGLAMRRLAIIGVANGRQPILSEDGNLALILNGEIYNYQDLRRELLGRGHRFSTDSDAEVALHLFEEEGQDFVHRLRGMFALAIYDCRQERLTLARDRLGKKPLYYALEDGFLVFASEIKAIHSSELIAKRLNGFGLRSYLAMGFVPGEETLFRGVKKLPSGSMLEVSDEGIRAWRYWDLAQQERRKPTDGHETERLRSLFEEAVRIRLVSEVPLGAFLSGGIDSSAVVGMMTRQLGGIVSTFSVGFDNTRYDELSYARVAARHFGTRHHEIVVSKVSAPIIREINWHYDEPAGDPASVPTYCLSKYAREHVTVVLTGEGGDEVFAGYPHYRHGARLHNLEARIPFLSSVARVTGSVGNGFRYPIAPRTRKALWLAALHPDERLAAWTSCFTDRELDLLLQPFHRQVQRQAATDQYVQSVARRSTHLDSLGRQLYYDTSSGLADLLLMKVDKMTMAASLEARCPLLDQQLVSFAWGLPSESKLSRDDSKIVFKKAIQDLVPPEILHRRKQGFDVPLGLWLRRDLESLVAELVLSSASPLVSLLDHKALQTMWSRLRAKSDGPLAMQLWRIVNLAVWLDLHWPQSNPIAKENAS